MKKMNEHDFQIYIDNKLEIEYVFTGDKPAKALPEMIRALGKESIIQMLKQKNEELKNALGSTSNFRHDN